MKIQNEGQFKDRIVGFGIMDGNNNVGQPQRESKVMTSQIGEELD